MARRRGGGNQNQQGGQQNNRNQQQGRNRGGGGQIPWNRLTDQQVADALLRQQKNEDQDWIAKEEAERRTRKDKKAADAEQQRQQLRKEQLEDQDRADRAAEEQRKRDEAARKEAEAKAETATKATKEKVTADEETAEKRRQQARKERIEDEDRATAARKEAKEESGKSSAGAVELRSKFQTVVAACYRLSTAKTERLVREQLDRLLALIGPEAQVSFFKVITNVKPGEDEEVNTKARIVALATAMELMASKPKPDDTAAVEILIDHGYIM